MQPVADFWSGLGTFLGYAGVIWDIGSISTSADADFDGGGKWAAVAEEIGLQQQSGGAVGVPGARRRAGLPGGGMFGRSSASLLAQEVRGLSWIIVPFTLFMVAAGLRWNSIRKRGQNLQSGAEPWHWVGLLIALTVFFVIYTNTAQQPELSAGQRKSLLDLGPVQLLNVALESDYVNRYSIAGTFFGMLFMRRWCCVGGGRAKRRSGGHHRRRRHGERRHS